MKKTIVCIGDSVTEGIISGFGHSAAYGGPSYPSRLTTILTDEGFDVEVTNCGHGGECLSAIVGRLGGVACYVSENIVIPADNSPASLGKKTFVGGHIGNTKLRLCYPDTDGEDCCVFFTQPTFETNPVSIDGVEYIISERDSTNFIQRKEPSGKETVIPKGALVFTSMNRSADINVIFGGLNDGGALTLKRWLDNMEACGRVNGGKYIIIGGHIPNNHPLWCCWPDVKGDTPEEKYEFYRRAALERFGIHFVDLYEEFPRRGMDIMLDAGFFKDKSREELAVMRQKLEAHIIPAEITVDGVADRNVHLSCEGYHIMAKLVAERIKLLGYLN